MKDMGTEFSQPLLYNIQSCMTIVMYRISDFWNCLFAWYSQVPPGTVSMEHRLLHVCIIRTCIYCQMSLHDCMFRECMLVATTF